MMILINFFYSLSAFFILFEIYQSVFRNNLYFRQTDIKSLKYITFAISKLSYMGWISIGFFSELKSLFLFLFLLGFCKVFTLKMGKKVINLYDIFNTITSVIMLSKIFYLGFLQ